ncbi:MAG: hypothetical protein KGL39_42865 [Patescibacteria group bacterium]|nr:hypothetical protein [Patescibacteria group bacterium]
MEDEIKQVVDFVEECIQKAERLESKITEEVAMLRGFSSPKIRHLLNNLCSFEGCYYLEIGTWGGSTLIPALWDNPVSNVLAIDDFSQFGPEQNNGFDAKKGLFENLEKYKDHVKRSGFWEGSMSKLPVSARPPANVFFYDGPHDAFQTEWAIISYGQRCSDRFILIVDDWELTPEVQAGTNKALEHFEVVHKWELKKAAGYHEGIAIFLLKGVED